MSKRSLFVSFAESDGGHSYLAARALLNPASVAHLVFRNTVSESLDSVSSGQANCAIVPLYNTITQWEGTTLKALASGQFEICAQVCMPTSYVLVAHKEYMAEFVSAYVSLMNLQKEPTPEDAAKIYNRFLSRIFVGAQADQQYRGRFTRPDMSHATIELSRNPLRVLEELTRAELIKAMATPRPGPMVQPLPQNMSGGAINLGGTPYPQAMPMTAPQPVMDILQAPAALVAEGLLNAPGDPEGWDQPGSLGEIVALLRKLLVLLNVYSFGAPDHPENQTQYLLVKRKGDSQFPPVDTLLSTYLRSNEVKRIMTLVRSQEKSSTPDEWMTPRDILGSRLKGTGYVLDRAPLMVSSAREKFFLIEGGRPREAAVGNPKQYLGKGKNAPKTLREKIEKKVELKDEGPKFSLAYLGEYTSWCHELDAKSCLCCSETRPGKEKKKSWFANWFTVRTATWIASTLLGIAILALVAGPIWCSMTGSCDVPRDPQSWQPPATTAPPPSSTPSPRETAPSAAPPSGTSTERPSYPGLAPSAVPATVAPASPYPGLSPSAPATRSEPPRQPSFTPPKPLMFHVAFFEAKSNLTREAMDALTAAAGQAIQLNRLVHIRVVALGARETDENLWRRRLYAVKDELVRLGVPFDRIRSEGTGPYVVIMKPNEPARPASAHQRMSYDIDAIDDPLSND